jgi:hypothetical protein
MASPLVCPGARLANIDRNLARRFSNCQVHAFENTVQPLIQTGQVSRAAHFDIEKDFSKTCLV